VVKVIASTLFLCLSLACSLAEAQLSAEIWFAGTGQSSLRTTPYPSNEPAGTWKSLNLGNPFGVEVQGDRIWITSVDDQCIYEGSIAKGEFQRVAGDGLLGYGGDGGLATQARFNWPHEVRVDTNGDLYVADTRNHVIRKIDGTTRIITTIAGDGTEGFAGDGKSGAEVRFRQPHSVVLDGQGGLLVADTVNHRLRRIELSTGIVTTISGNGEKKLPIDGADASTSPLFGPRSLAVDGQSIWIALREGNSVWRLDRRANTLHHVAGTGGKGYEGDGGDPLEATFNGPKGLVLDDAGRLLIVDTENHAVRRVDIKKRTVETVMGVKANRDPIELKRPHGIAFSSQHGFFVADSEQHRVLRGDISR
jgi:streptogramin lyase